MVDTRLSRCNAIAAVVATLGMTHAAAVDPPPPSGPDLCGVWSAEDGALISITQSGGRIASKFIKGGVTTQGAQLSSFIAGALTGTQLKGEMQRATERADLVQRGAPDSWSTPFTATASDTRISGTFLQQRFVMQAGRVRLDPNRSGLPARDFQLTRPDCATRNKEIEAVKTALKGSRKMLDLYTNINSRGRTFSDVQNAIGQQVATVNLNDKDFAGGNALAVGGSTEPTYTLIGDRNAPFKDYEVEIAFKTTGSKSAVIDAMARRHEAGHVEDLQSDWKTHVKTSQWDRQKWDDYFYGWSKDPKLVQPRIDSEKKAYQMEVKLLTDWLNALAPCQPCGP